MIQSQGDISADADKQLIVCPVGILAILVVGDKYRIDIEQLIYQQFSRARAQFMI